MRKLTLVLFFVSLAMAVFAWPTSSEVRKANGAIMGWNNTTKEWQPLAVTGDGKLVTDAAVTVGAVTVSAGTPPDINSTTAVAVTATAANVASLANRKSVTVVNTSATETLWVSFDSVTASAAANLGVPIYPYGYKSIDLSEDLIVGLYSATALTGIVYQDGYLP